MKNYAPENATFLLPFQFDVEKLQYDLDTCRKFKFLRHYVPQNYEGDNYTLPLRSIEGQLDFAVALPNNSNRFEDTAALLDCTYFKKVIDTFQCQKEAIRLMNMTPGRIMKTHTDYQCGYEDGVFRVHIPILTNDKVCFMLNNKRLIMQPGEAWYGNFNLPHSVRNDGNTDRVHLVMDCIRNEWSDSMFEAIGYDFDKEGDVQEVLSDDTKMRMIEELERQSTPAAKKLIKQLKNS